MTDATPEDLRPRLPLKQRLVAAAIDNNLLVAAILLQATFLVVVGSKLVGVDSWLTFLAGREIWQNGLPHREVLTTMAAGRTWTDQQWLAQIGFYSLERLGGVGLA